MTTLYAAAEAAGACEQGLRQARELGLEGVPCTLAGWRAAEAAGLDEDSLVWVVRVLPVEALPELAEEEDPVVRQAVAERADCPPAVLRVLAEDEDAPVYMVARAHWACPLEARWTAAAARHPA